MGSDRVSEVSAGGREKVGGMVNVTSLTSGSITGPGACEDGRPVEVETRIQNELTEFGGFLEGDRGGFGKEVLILHNPGLLTIPLCHFLKTP